MTNSRWNRLQIGDPLESAASGHRYVIMDIDRKSIKGGREQYVTGIIVGKIVRAHDPKQWSVVKSDTRRKLESL